jgi:L-seryl-tRNA(Ser) seleniumtransferase
MDDITRKNLLKQIPEPEDLLIYPVLTFYIETYSKERVLDKLEEVIEETRTEIHKGKTGNVNSRELVYSAINKLSSDFKPELNPVINSTGIVIHPYLGRAPLSKEVISHITSTAIGYCNLDFDIKKGTKLGRVNHLNKLLCQITGSEAALVVNNNAAALLLIAATFAKNREIILSRGEVIEIEDEFRLPEIIEASGSKLIEVGTTNRSFLKDYSQAINENTSILMKVHTSSYYIKGHTNKVELFALVELARSKNLLCVEDLGTGLLIDLRNFGLPYEPTIQEILKTDVDLITFSGDKLLGGSQSGIILGKKVFIERLLQNPLLRSLRPDKLTISAIEGTLQFYLNPEKAIENIPVLQMLTKPIKQLELDASLMAEDLKQKGSITYDIKKIFQNAGGSILPEVKLPTYALFIKHNKFDACTLHQKFLDHGVVTMLQDDAILIDPRCMLKRDFRALAMIFEQVL